MRTQCKSNLDGLESEAERLRLVIAELSRKIQSEPEKNLIERVISNSNCGKFHVRVLEITADGAKFDSLQYTVRGKNGWHTSKDSQKIQGFDSTYLFDLKDEARPEILVDKFEEIFELKIFGNTGT